MLASVVAGGLVLSLAVGGAAQAQSQSHCDAGVTRALARKVSCTLRVFAGAQRRGTVPDASRLATCEGKFASACAKAQSRSDCQAQAASCAELAARADAAVEDLRGAPTTSTTTTTSTSTTLDPFRPCGPDAGATCGGVCASLVDECVPDGQTGTCACVPGPCRAIGGAGSCGGTCAHPSAVCTAFPPGSCACVIPCAGSGAAPCAPACLPGQGCLFNPDTAACECAP